MKPTGRLQLTWTNKHLCLLSHGSDTYEWVEPTDWRVTEVRPLRHVESVGAAGSGNLLIEGDAAHGLDALLKVPELAAQYRGKVKLCYIDPPFNTGQAFEHYKDAVEHSVWLTMLRDRLTQILDLLSPDGSVWVHLDDAEVHRCRCVLDEVLGADNFASAVIWRGSDNSNNDAKQLSEDYHTLLVYTKTPGWTTNREVGGDRQSHYRNPTNDPRGLYFDGNPLNSPNPRENLRYTLVAPDGKVISPPPNGWRWSRETLEQKIEDGEVHWRDDCSGIYRRTYLADHLGLPPSNLWTNLNETGHSRGAKSELKKLFPGVATSDLFDTPKPELLMKRIIQIGTNPGDIVLDCYAGSGTTAAVAHKLGRRWVTSEVSPSTVAGFTQPRLTKVVRDEDPGGITSSTAVEFVGDLPEGLAPADVNRAANFLKGLREHGIFDELPKPKRNQHGGPLAQVVAVLKEHPEVQDVLLETMAKQMRAAARTKKVETTLWAGGGGFDVAKVAPSMFVEEDGRLFLAEWAIGGALAEAVAAQVGYTVDMDGPFAGRKGRSRLAVLDGMLTCGVADFLVEQLGARETVLVIAQTLEPGVDEHLRKARAGSRARKVPRDLARRSPLSGLKVRVRPAPKDVAGTQASDANDGNS